MHTLSEFIIQNISITKTLLILFIKSNFCKKKAPIKGTFEYLADLVFDPTLAYWRVRLGLPHY